MQAGLRAVTVKVPDDRHRRLKMVAVREGKTITEIVNGLIEAWVSKKESDDE